MATRTAEFDVCIIGGSVAGSTAARTLLEQGLSIAIVERDALFRDRARSEGLHPWGMDEAEDPGLLDILDEAGAHPLPIWQTYADRLPLEPFHWAFESALGHIEHGVFHPQLPETILRHAVANGATLFRPASQKRGGRNTKLRASPTLILVVLMTLPR